MLTEFMDRYLFGGLLQPSQPKADSATLSKIRDQTVFVDVSSVNYFGRYLFA